MPASHLGDRSSVLKALLHDPTLLVSRPGSSPALARRKITLIANRHQEWCPSSDGGHDHRATLLTPISNIERNERVWIATGHTDMRRGMQGLALQVQESLKRDPHAGDLYAGFYPDTIAADVSPARLARYFSKEHAGYRVLPELRSNVIFTVQDVLKDPPFSRLDLVSCRNLLIAYQPDLIVFTTGDFQSDAVFEVALPEAVWPKKNDEPQSCNWRECEYAQA